MWAYPREFGDADSASQVSGSPNSFTAIRGASHMFLLLSGYAIFDNPTMPIIGPGETANDTYVEQLVASAQAAIDKVVEMGVADRDRIGIGGHSYGGFMTANLLAHSRLFRAGFAESAAPTTDRSRRSASRPSAAPSGRCRISTRRCRRSGMHTKSRTRSY